MPSHTSSTLYVVNTGRSFPFSISFLFYGWLFYYYLYIIEYIFCIKYLEACCNFNFISSECTFAWLCFLALYYPFSSFSLMKEKKKRENNNIVIQKVILCIWSQYVVSQLQISAFQCQHLNHWCYLIHTNVLQWCGKCIFLCYLGQICILFGAN